MKLHFESNLEYQQKAIEAVCDLFHGQEINRSEFTVTMRPVVTDQMSMPDSAASRGFGNKLALLDDQILKNMNDVQLRNALPPSASLSSRDFSVEMETGTGKTYVYLRSIFELNKQFGFTKFVIVVPSVAIKEGVYKTLQITEDHFRQLYAGVPFDYFIYDSTKLGQVRNFATSNNIQIMIVTVGAINKKDVNNLYKESEKTGGESPIDLIKNTHPIVIVDEPQSVDGGLEGRGKEALDAMNPLCTLRYSATHFHDYHKVYRLDAVDAYERKLVKQIEVASATVEEAFNKPFVRLLKVENKRGKVSAQVEVDIATRGGVKRNEVTVFDSDNLQHTTGRDLYADLRIGDIYASKEEPSMELYYPGGIISLKPGEAHGDVNLLAFQRQMIRRTIHEHLEKELRLRSRGIKVLSLFFIDHVAKYRQYDKDGNAVKGEYAHIFEEEYKRASQKPRYKTLFAEVDLSHSAEEVHDGYFSIDKKGSWADTAENNAANRESAERAYNLIMKDKEKLLSFETPLKFIFSHSALREGWDSPNVFQICNLRDMNSERERRQTIGRGLRLCVNQEGERLHGFEINTLTVIANESYESFASELQKEIEKDTGIRFGIVEKHLFAAIATTGEDGQLVSLGLETSEALWQQLRDAKLIDTHGKVQDELRTALKAGTLALSPELEAHRPQIEEMLRKVCGKLDIKKAEDRRPVALNKAIYLSDDFKELWNRIKARTTYRVEFDNEKLLEDCSNALRKAPPIESARLQWRRADLSIQKDGVIAEERDGAATIVLDEEDIELPDLLTELQNKTQLTRRSITRILTGSRRLEDFKRNPQQFIEYAGKQINDCKSLSLVDGIKYLRLGDEDFYAQELFQTEELTGYLENMLEDAKKSVFEHVVYDSETEKTFAQKMEKFEAVKLYAKLPGWFKVATPLGSYNPDWAILVEKNDQQKLYFVVETKSSLFAEDLRANENGKIECGKAHFKALETQDSPAEYRVESKLESLLGTL